MRVGVDLTSFTPGSTDGVSTFSLGMADGLLRSLSAQDQLVILVSRRNADDLKQRYPDKRVEFHEFSFEFGPRLVNRMIWLLSWTLQEFRLRYWYERCFRRGLDQRLARIIDALIVPTTVFNFYALSFPTILCIHDIQQEYYPENFTLHQRVLRWASYRLSCSRATRIQVSSSYIRSCLLEKFKFIPQDKIFIAPEGVDGNRFAFSALDTQPSFPGFDPAQPFVFYPAQIWKHKNHEMLVRSLAEFRDRSGSEMQCVLTGHDFGHWAVIENLIAALGLKSVFYMGRVEFSELIWLYKHCAAVLALGVHESSSLPVREGAAFGKPLIAVDIQPNIEAQEYLNLTLIDHQDPVCLTDAICHIACHDQATIMQAEENVEKVKRLDWSVVLGLYLQALEAAH